jgi:asparagine synthase (glutamine-hydrolysing)
MCGIVGIHGRQEKAWIDAMNQRIRHRGPDEEGIYRDAERELAFGMRRLAIVDLSGGHQPMATADGNGVLAYNGEIYNAPELRAELEARGVRFRTSNSDTEVLLQLLVRDGEAALPRLNGMFAFAYYDRARGSLLCARDRFGIKPFYFTRAGGRFAFASELKSLLALPCVDRQINRRSLFHYMSLMYLPDGPSILEDIERLPAGSALVYRLADRSITVRQWWRPRFAPDGRTDAREWPERVLEGLKAAVKRWTLADVPIAASLSGGLDSSAIVGALAEAGLHVRTYALGFTGAGEAAWNELPRAQAVARHWGTEHHEIVLDPQRLLDDLVAMVWHLDEPYGGGLPSWSVFQFMGRDVKVGLTGTGGDELFGDYQKWKQLEGGPLRRWRPPVIDAAAFNKRFFERYYYFSDRDKAVLALEGAAGESTSELLYRRYGAAGTDEVRDRVSFTDMTTQLAEEFLHMTDRFSMAHSVEARTPFLDNEFADLALSIPAAHRTGRGDPKALLRRAVAPLLPPEVREAPKMGFVLPLRLWLRGPLKPLVERLLDPARLRAQGLFKPVFVERFVRPHLTAQADHTQKVWAAIMFQLWHLLFIERGGPPDFTLADLA